jgi:hypothetical protein
MSEDSLSDYRALVITELRDAHNVLKIRKPTDEEFPFTTDHGNEVEIYDDPFRTIVKNISGKENLFNFYMHLSYDWSLRNNEYFISEIEEYFDGFLVPEKVYTSHSLYIPAVKAKHLQIACIGLYRYCRLQPLDVQKKRIAQILASIFRSSEQEFFSAGKIERPFAIKLQENDLKQVAKFFQDIANIINDELERDPQNGYFSKD